MKKLMLSQITIDKVSARSGCQQNGQRITQSTYQTDAIPAMGITSFSLSP